MRMPSRTVERLTPNCSARWVSVGSRIAGLQARHFDDLLLDRVEDQAVDGKRYRAS
jgi:hypothetical protein